MLEHLLLLVRQGGLQTSDGLARQMGVTPTLVEMMLADLQRRGVVAQSGTCGDGCNGCDVASACGQGGAQRLWRLRTPQE